MAWTARGGGLGGIGAMEVGGKRKGFSQRGGVLNKVLPGEYVGGLVGVASGPWVHDSVSNRLNHREGERSLWGPCHTEGGPFCGTKGYEFALPDFQTKITSLGSEIRKWSVMRVSGEDCPCPIVG